MDHLHGRLEVLERQVQTLHQQTHTVTRQLRWWRGVAEGLLAVAVLTWALPAGIAQDDPTAGGRERLAHTLPPLEPLRILLRHLTIAPDEEGRPEVRITGANPRVVNGLGRTDCPPLTGVPDCPNGVGNLIVGYNEPRDEELFGPNLRTGSHTIGVGSQHNFASVGGLVVGLQNTVSGPFASVSGGGWQYGQRRVGVGERRRKQYGQCHWGGRQWRAPQHRQRE